jgi:hypothetical protein
MFLQPFHRLCLAAALLGVALVAGCAGMERRPPPTLDEIVEMSRAGTPPEEIVRVLQETRAVYPLTGSQIVRLHQDGVPDPVLDYLQNAYAEAIRWDAQWRYESMHWYWWRDCYYCYPRPVIVVPY